MVFKRINILVLMVTALTLFLSACTGTGERGLEGQILNGDEPLAGAGVEIYLKAEKDRSTLPFAATSTDSAGRFRIDLPAGQYFIIGKKKEMTEDGRTRMLMAECPANPIEVTDRVRTVAPFSLREMGRDGGLIAEPQTGIVGRLVHQGEVVSHGFVYVYAESESGLIGPSYGEAVQSEDDGRFRIDLPSGRFFLAARKRSDGGRMGEPEAGDLNANYPGNPISVAAGEYRDIGDFRLAAVDATARTKKLDEGKFEQTATRFEGRVVNRDGQPVSGIFVFAYLDSRMVGKPTYISAPTGADGRYVLNLGAGGTYYLGARSTYGGPLEPGEWVGTHDGQADHSVRVEAGQVEALSDIIVREVW